MEWRVKTIHRGQLLYEYIKADNMVIDGGVLIFKRYARENEVGDWRITVALGPGFWVEVVPLEEKRVPVEDAQDVVQEAS